MGPRCRLLRGLRDERLRLCLGCRRGRSSPDCRGPGCGCPGLGDARSIDARADIPDGRCRIRSSLGNTRSLNCRLGTGRWSRRDLRRNARLRLCGRQSRPNGLGLRLGSATGVFFRFIVRGRSFSAIRFSQAGAAAVAGPGASAAAGADASAAAGSSESTSVRRGPAWAIGM